MKLVVTGRSPTPGTTPGTVRCVRARLGNSPAAAQAHYLQVRDHHFDLAACLAPGSALQNALPHGAERRRTASQTLIPDAA